jgi:putative DNA primase/helicase
MIDCDHPQYIDLVENFLPRTFSVRSSSDRKRHFYYIFINFPEGKTKFSLIDPDNPEDKDLQGGDIRYGNYYVVGPGSIHPDTGKPYEVIDDVPIATVDYKEIFNLLHLYYKKKEGIAPKGMERRDYPLPISAVLEYYNVVMKASSGGEYYCAHPIHGSESGGTNFGVNINKNVWCCRRCNSGGGVVHLVALLAKLIDCASLQFSIPDDIRIAALNIIKEEFGIDLRYEYQAPLNDTYNANIFAKTNSKLIRYCTTFKSWYVYDGQVWRKDETNLIRKMADDTYIKLTKETPYWVPTISDEDQEDVCKTKEAVIKAWKTHVKSSGEASHLDNMVTVSTKDLSVHESQFDMDDHLICLKNGVFDLKTYQLLPFNEDFMMTKQANFSYDPQAQCPNWERLMRIIFINDDSLIKYFQRALGYCLTADISRQMFFILHGGGSNGKSTGIDTVKYGMGDYAANIRSQSLLVKKDDSIPNDWAALRKMRMVVAAELETSKELDTAIVKQFTSRKPMSVRFLHKEYFDMEPTFKVFLETNPLPNIKGDDYGTWRRIKKIPFMYKFREEDKVIDYDKIHLYPELSGIFNWLLAGLKDLNENGEQEPEVVKVSTQEYRENENSLYEFIEKHCYPLSESKGSYTLSSDLWDYYRNVVKREGDNPYGKRNFPALLEACGVKKTRLTFGEHKGKFAYIGIRCKSIIDGGCYLTEIRPPESFSDITI